jgi:protocatechuate 3,4-dioxygenase beta subunit
VHRFVLTVAILLISASFCAQSLCAQSKAKKVEDASAPRELSGAVFDQAGHPVSGALVYLKNTQSLGILTYITGGDGAYRFNHLAPDVEYQVHAEADGHKSKMRTLGAADAHKQPHLKLILGK